MHRIVEQFTGHDAGALIQFVKYAIGGGLATLTHIIVFHVAAWRILPALQENDSLVRLLKLRTVARPRNVRSRNSMIDNGIAFLFSNAVAYIVNAHWVFTPGRHSPIVEIELFYLVSGASIVIGTATMGILIRRYGVRTTYAFLANLVAALLINYAMRKFVIFKG